MDADPLYEELAALAGAPSVSVRASPDPVSGSQIRRWVEAFGDYNPIYVDERAALASGRTGIVAPPAMLAAFTGRGLRELRNEGEPKGLSLVFKNHGMVSPAVSVAQSYETELHPGDFVKETMQVESVGQRKTTKLGGGYFLTLRSDFTNQTGCRLGTHRFTIFAFQPSKTEEPQVGEQVAAKSSTGSSQQPKPTLPPLMVQTDRLGVIACANACGDFMAGHYDPDIARGFGFADIFTDSYTALGFAQRFVTDWAGPRARIEKIELRLGASLFAGDTLQINGEATAQSDGLTLVNLRGLCKTGVHIDGRVTLRRGA
jgi:acyl dehydratase